MFCAVPVVRLAVPLFMCVAVQLSGCAQSSRAPEVSTAEFTRSKEQKVVPLAPATLADSDEKCAYRSMRGVAEIVAVDSGRVVLRFYPGDRLFTRTPAELQRVDIRVGDEYRAWRNERIAGDCDMVTYRLVEGAAEQLLSFAGDA